MVCSKEEMHVQWNPIIPDSLYTSFLCLPNMDFGPNSNFSYMNNSLYDRNPYRLDILFVSKGVRYRGVSLYQEISLIKYF